MNTEENNINQEEHLNQENALDNKKNWEMQEEIELLREQVNSLKQLLCHAHNLTNEYIQEIAYTKQEIEWMNQEISVLMTSNKQPIYQEKELDKRIVEEKYHSESITESIAPIARSPVKVNEFEESEYSVVRTRSHKLKAQSRESRNRSAQIISLSTQITAQSAQIRNQSREITLHSREVREQCDRMKVGLNALHSPRCSPKGNSAESVSGFLLEARFSRFPLDSQRKAIASATPPDG